jgi:immunoglobulin-like protein involved in spore germination/sporulation and spore germination protein
MMPDQHGGWLYGPQRRRLSAALLSAALFTLVLTACGSDDRSNEDSSNGSSAGGGTQDSEDDVDEFSFEVWFVKDETLQASSRTAERTAAVGKLSLTALLEGPSSAEQEIGLETAIPSDTHLVGLEVDDGEATVDLTPAYESGRGSLSMRMRLAQVVYTLTQFPTVSNVSFQLDGEPVTTFSAEGIVMEGPLGREDFADLLPPISVEQPLLGAEISSPVTVSGTANVFEATVSIRILDAQGNEIAKTFTTATCGTGCRGDYSEKVEFKVDARQAGIIEVYEESAEDGSQLFTVSVPVTLVPKN